MLNLTRAGRAPDNGGPHLLYRQGDPTKFQLFSDLHVYIAKRKPIDVVKGIDALVGVGDICQGAAGADETNENLSFPEVRTSAYAEPAEADKAGRTTRFQPSGFARRRRLLVGARSTGPRSPRSSRRHRRTKRRRSSPLPKHARRPSPSLIEPGENDEDDQREKRIRQEARRRRTCADAGAGIRARPR